MKDVQEEYMIYSSQSIQKQPISQEMWDKWLVDDS